MLKNKGLGSKLAALFGRARRTDALYEELEDLLVESDFGAASSMEAVDRLRDRIGRKGMESREVLVQEMKDILSENLVVQPLTPETGKLSLYLVFGVNGVGKTTTIAKLAHFYRKKRQADKILLCAGDTFRAAAAEQLRQHGDRLNLKVVSQTAGSDPGAVLFDSISSARANNMDLILADTAGRMHTRKTLVQELGKLDKIARSKMEGSPYRKILVVDATTGQNAMHQVQVFHEAIGIDSIILAKYDSTAKGGMVIPICRDTGIPFSFMGTGEKLDDLVVFDRDLYLDSLLGV